MSGGLESSIMTNIKPTTGFSTSYIDGVRTLPQNPDTVSQETIFFRFLE